MAAADLRDAELQRAVNPARSTALSICSDRSETALAPRGSDPALPQCRVSAPLHPVKMADQLLQIAIPVLHQLMQPVNQFDIGIAAQLAKAVALSSEVNSSVSSLPNSTARLISDMMISDG